jgi:hypothetical protein
MNDPYKAYLKWLVTPEEKRRPRTLESFMEDNDLTRDEIEYFREQESFEADVAVATYKWAKDQAPDMLKKLYDTAMSTGKADLIKAYLDIIKTQEKEDGSKLEDIISITKFSDAQRQQIIDRISGRGGFDMPGSEE